MAATELLKLMALMKRWSQTGPRLLAARTRLRMKIKIKKCRFILLINGVIMNFFILL